MKYIGLNSSWIKVLWNWALVYCSTIGEISVFGHINEMGHSSVLQRMGMRGEEVNYLLIGVLIEPKQFNIVLPLVKCYTSPWSLGHWNGNPHFFNLESKMDTEMKCQPSLLQFCYQTGSELVLLTMIWKEAEKTVAS